jgi:hypothetical protein
VDDLNQSWSGSGHHAQDWRERLDHLDERTSAAPSEVADSLPASSWQLDVGTGEERDPSEVIEDALQWVQGIESAKSTEVGERKGTGRAVGGNLVIVLSPQGLASCQVDPDWADQQTGKALGAALTEALEAARADLQASKESREANALFAELMALMGHIHERVPTLGKRPSAASREEQL